MNPYNFDKIEHIHSFKGEPLMGCSTVVGIINKPLGWWVAEQTLKPLGWSKYNKKVKGKYVIVPDKERLPAVETILRGIREMKPKVWMELLDSCYKNHNKKKDEAAEKGTERHALLEIWVKDCIKNYGGKPVIEDPIKEIINTPDILSFMFWSQQNVKQFLWSEAHSYSELLWTGGIADVGWLDMQDRIVAGDFKSSKDVFFSQFVQIGGYDIMLSENGGYTAEGDKIFELPGPIEAYCVAPFGQEEFNPIVLDYVEDFKAAFRSSVHSYKLNKLFDQVKKGINQAEPIKTVEEPKEDGASKLVTLNELLEA